MIAALLLTVTGISFTASPASAFSNFTLDLVPLGPMIAGTSVELEARVYNGGPDAAEDSLLKIELPAGITPAGADQACIDTECLIGSFGLINVGETATRRISVAIDPDFVVDNGGGTAFAGAPIPMEVDYDGGAQSSTRRLIVGERSDLRIRKYVNPPVANAGELVTYMVDVDNLGPSTARTVAIADALFAGAGRPGASAIVQSCQFSSAGSGGIITQFTCADGPVTTVSLDTGTFVADKVQPIGLYPTADDPAVGGRLRAVLTLTSNDANTFTNEARVVAATPDPDTSNNIASAPLSVNAVADLGITASASAPSADPGTNVTYTLTVANNGPSDATNVVVTDDLPAGVDLVSATTPGGSCLAGTPGDPNRPVRCQLGTIGRPVGGVAQTKVVTVTIKLPPAATPGATVTNQAWVASGVPDLVNTNDGVESTTTVSAADRLFNPLNPARQFDTRDGTGGVPVGKVMPGTPLEFTVTGVGGVPAGATAVNLNVTADAPDGAGFVTVYPCAAGQPLASNLNLVAGRAVANAVVAPVDAAGKVCFAASVPTHLISDVSGWFRPAEGLTTMTPVRSFDTRDGSGGVPTGKRDAGSVLKLKVTGVNGVPNAGVSAVALNVTVDAPDATGFVTVFPCGPQPVASNVNFTAGEIVPNLVVAPVSPQGEVCFATSARTHLLADLSGWFATGSDHRSLNPTRVFDTRTGLGGVSGTLVPGATIEVPVTGKPGLAATGAGSVVLNVTAVNPVHPGFITAFPCGDRPLASNVNYAVGRTTANAVIAPVSPQGTVCFYTNGGTDLLADISGWFVGSGPS